MPGREDFGVVRSRLLTDERAHTAAAAYAVAGIAADEFSMGAVCGHVAMLGLWAMRETDDGVLPGDGRWAASQAMMVSREGAGRIIEILTAAGLLRPVAKGIYLVGFRDCYEPIITRRELNRESHEKARKSLKKRTSAGRPQDVTTTSDGGPDLPAVPCRAVPSDELHPPPLQKRVSERMERVLNYVIRCGAHHETEVAAEQRRRLRSGAMTEDEARALMEGSYRWVTSDRLARGIDGPTNHGEPQNGGWEWIEAGPDAMDEAEAIAPPPAPKPKTAGPPPQPIRAATPEAQAAIGGLTQEQIVESQRAQEAIRARIMDQIRSAPPAPRVQIAATLPPLPQVATAEPDVAPVSDAELRRAQEQLRASHGLRASDGLPSHYDNGKE